MTITGTNFGSDSSSNVVQFGAVRAQIVSASSTSIQVSVPLGAVYGNISVTTLNGKSAFSSVPFLPTFLPTGPITDRSFAQAASFPPSGKPVVVSLSTGYSSPTQGIKSCDFDGDGKPDLIVADWNNNNVVIFRNTDPSTSGTIQSSSFTIVATLSVGSRPTDIAVGDLDGDSKPDIVVANWNDNTITVFQNTSTLGIISFAPPITLTMPFPYAAGPPSCVKLADIDGDGWLDIIVSGQNPGVYRNKGLGGSLTAISFEPIVTFTVSGGAAYDLAVGDLDGDGKPDLAVTGYPNQCSVLRNISTPGTIAFATPLQLQTASSYYGGIAISDLNGDNKPELIVGCGTLSIFPNQSTPGSLSAFSFGTRIDVPVSTSIYRLSVADLNGDGLPDIVATNGGVQVFINGGSASLASSFTTSVQLNISSGSLGTGSYGRVAIGDLNGDGKPDIVVDGQYGAIQISQNFVQALTVSSFAISPTNASVTVPWYHSTSLSALEMMSDGSSIDVTSAAIWNTSNPSVATVTSLGKVNGVAAGTVTISASYSGSVSQATVSVISTSYGTNPGNPDSRFMPTMYNSGSNGSVYAFAVQPDGKVVVGGLFSSVNGITRNNLARINDDGSLDTSFDPGTGTDGTVKSLALDSSGNILIVGSFSSVNGTSRPGAARILPNGTLDTSFNANLSNSSSQWANVVCVRPNGSILIGGDEYQTLQINGSTASKYLIQINQFGVLDSTFTADTSLSGETNTLAIQSDGSALIGGSFLGPGNNLLCLARLGTTGIIDQAFQIGIQTSRVYGLALQPDGKIVVVGDFSKVFGQSISFVTRFNTDGSLDSSFTSPATVFWGIIPSVALQANGKIVLAKSFGTVRLNPGGSVDTSYIATVAPDWAVSTVAVTPNEEIWEAGGISSVNGFPTMGIARLHGDVTTFLGWQTKYFSQQQLSNAATTGSTGDAVGNGIPNLLKYALNMNPTLSSLSGLPLLGFATDTANNNYLSLTYTKLISSKDITYLPQVSADLQTWNSGPTFTGLLSVTDNADSVTQTVVVQDLTPINGSSKRFIRLKVTNP